MMNLNNIKYLLFILIFTSNSFADTAENLASSKTVIDNVEVQEDEKYKLLSPAIKIGIGMSTNPVLLPTDEVKSSFFLISPSMGFDAELVSDKLYFLSNINANYKKYNKSIVDEVQSKIDVQLDLGLSYFFNAHHEVGITGSGVLNRGSSLNFTNSGLIDDQKGRDVDFIQSFIEAYYSFNQDSYYIELSVSNISKRNDGLVQVFDSAGAISEFKDDFDQVGAKLKLNYKINSSVDIFLEPNYSKRKYLNRSAHSSEGSTNQGVHPDLVELHRGLTMGYDFNDGFGLKLKALYTKESDLIFKANNADSYGFEGELKLPIGPIFDVQAKYSWLQRNYDFFVTNPEQNPSSRDLREDVENSFTFGIAKQFNDFLVNLNYVRVSKDSNYRPNGSSIGSVYDDDIVTMDLTLIL